VLGFKGLERGAVVVVINEESEFERSRERSGPFLGDGLAPLVKPQLVTEPALDPEDLPKI
jgi:hypothetical protein